MQIVKTKQRIPIFDLLLGLGLLALGVVILILPIYDLEDIFLLLFALLMFVCGIVGLISLLNREKYLPAALCLVLCWTLSVLILMSHFGVIKATFVPCIVVGIVAMLLGILRLVICGNCIVNKTGGALRNGISGVACIAFAILLLLNPVKSFGTLTFVVGFYLIFYGFTSLFDAFASMFRFDLDESKTRRRTHFAVPNIITALEPVRMIKRINKAREDGSVHGGMLVEVKPEADFDTVNLEVLVHLTTLGANKFGHVDIALGDKIYSYGTYDKSADRLGGFISQGTFIIVPKIPYLKYCLDRQKKYVIGFGAALSQKQLDGVKAKIDELMSNCEPLESKYEIAVKNGEDGSKLNDPASNIVRDVGGEVYTVTKGRFRRYFGISTNCVRVADWLLSDSGLDRVSFSSISTPGGYYYMLQNMFRRAHTRLIRKTTYIVADEIDDIEELRRLARSTKEELSTAKEQ